MLSAKRVGRKIVKTKNLYQIWYRFKMGREVYLVSDQERHCVGKFSCGWRFHLCTVRTIEDVIELLGSQKWILVDEYGRVYSGDGFLSDVKSRKDGMVHPNTVHFEDYDADWIHETDILVDLADSST